MKKIWIAGGAAAAVAAAVLVFVLTRPPATPEEQFAFAGAELEDFLRDPDLAEPELTAERDRILGEYRKVWEAFPPDAWEPKARKKIAELLLKWKRFEEALAAHKEFAEKFKEDPEAPDLLWTAADLALRDDPAEARRLYRLFVDRYPEHPRAPEALIEIARLMQKDDQFAPDDVRKIWQELIDSYPESDLRDVAMLGIAEFYRQAKAYDDAVKAYDEIIEEFEGKDSAAKALLEKGKLLAEKMDRKKEAKETLDKLAKEHPDSEPARRGSGMRRSLDRDLKKEKAEKREDDFFKEHYGAPAGDLFKSMGRPTDLWKRILAQQLDLETVAIEAAVDVEKGTLSATAKIRMRHGGKDKNSVLLQLQPTFNVTAAAVDGKKADLDQNANYLKIGIPGAPWKKDTSIEVSVTYSGGAGEAEGMMPLKLGMTGYAAPGAFWHPVTVYGDLFTGSLSITVPYGMGVRATGVAGPVRSAEMTSTHVFTAKEPVFGIFFGYGAYETHTKGRVTLSTITKDYPRADEYVKTANEILDFYSKAFGELPWKHLHLVEAELPPFIGGVSPANVIFLNSELMKKERVPVSLIAHELAHQWWGNLVPVAVQHEDYTPWLSEGLACYADALYLEHAYGKKRMEQHLSKAGLVYLERMTELPDVPIAECWWFHPQYHAVTYMKGTVAFHMLRKAMGDKPFADALRAYAREYEYKPGGRKNFRELCSKIAGKPLEDFFAQWIERDGFPQLKIERVQGGEEVELTVKQLGKPYTLDVTVLFEGGGRKEERPFPIAKETEVLKTKLPFAVERVVLDPRGVLLKRPGPQNEWKKRTDE